MARPASSVASMRNVTAPAAGAIARRIAASSTDIAF
jgi:hypothetical protein